MVNRGVGSVEKSFVVNTTTQPQVRRYRQQKTTMMPFVVGLKKDFLNKPIVEVGAQDIVSNAGLRQGEEVGAQQKTLRFQSSFQEMLAMRAYHLTSEILEVEGTVWRPPLLIAEYCDSMY